MWYLHVVGQSVGGLGAVLDFGKQALGLFTLSLLSEVIDSDILKLQKKELETLFHVSRISRGWGLGFWLLPSEKLSDNLCYVCYVCDCKIPEWALFPTRNLKNLELWSVVHLVLLSGIFLNGK